MYIAIVDNSLFKIADTLSELYSHFLTVEISGNGTVLVNGKEDSVSYNMDEYTDAEAKESFFRDRAKKFLPSISFFRLEPIN